MKTELITAVKQAKQSFNNKMLRPGHPIKNNDFIVNKNDQESILLHFIEKLETAEDAHDALNIVTDRLTDPKNTWHPYDFNQYLIDALETIQKAEDAMTAQIDWGCFTPSAVKRFKGVLFRGTSSPPEKIFAQGFQDYHPSPNIDAYLAPKNLSTGVSTSRLFSVAEQYTRMAYREGKRRFVYTIIYQGENGMDIIETAKARGTSLKSLLQPELTRAIENDEINVIQEIPKESIYCVTEFLNDNTQVTSYNPVFNGTYRPEKAIFQAIKPQQTLFQNLQSVIESLWSGFKAWLWALTNRHSIDKYGNDYRQSEINNTPIMQKAIATYEALIHKQSDYQSILTKLDSLPKIIPQSHQADYHDLSCTPPTHNEQPFTHDEIICLTL